MNDATLDADAARRRAVFLELHSNLPREGPGDRDSTARALAIAGALPLRPRVLDIACGPGAQTLDLAALLPDATIEAVDWDPRSVTEAQRRMAVAAVNQRVTVSRGDMRALGYPPASFDLIWCEGAVYVVGVERALGLWRHLLKPAGVLAFSENVWLRDDRPPDVRAFWDSAYPAMLTAQDCRALVRACGYRILGDFALPESAWWRDYYQPLAARIDALRVTHRDEPIALEVLDGAREEIDLYRRHSAYYGYLFVVVTPESSTTATT